MMQDFGISYNTEIEVTKGVPSGYGVGSSAASPAALPWHLAHFMT